MNKGKCTKGEFLSKLKEIVAELEEPDNSGQMMPSVCPHRQVGEQGHIKMHPTVCLDGQNAVPYPTINYDGQDAIPQKVKVLPHVFHGQATDKRQSLSIMMTCGAATKALQKTCQQPGGDAYCQCQVGQGPHSHLEAAAPGGKRRPGCYGKDHCTGRDSASQPFQCPRDSDHQHWSPRQSPCLYPRYCKAECTDHNPTRDWIDTRPLYRYYLQKRAYAPLMDST